MIQEYDVIRLTVDLPELQLKRGTVGTVLAIYSVPTPGYEVEVEGFEGTFGVQPNQIELVQTNGS
ncbi:DUF4926 domain-containing protein [Sphingopyxis fribergensis]|jgi:hypothetical protein